MLNNTQKNILKILKEEPEIKLKDLAEKLHLSSITNIHNNIKKLIDMGNLEKLGRHYTVKEDGTVPLSYIPYYGLAQCGTTDVLPEEKIIDYIPMPTKFLPGNIDDLFFIKAQGDSMSPTIEDGEMLLFEKLPTGTIPNPNDILLCFQGEGCKVKRLRRGPTGTQLVSDNKAYEPINLDAANEARIIAKLVKLKN